MAKTGSVLYFTLEQNRDQIKEMVMQMLSGVGIDAMRSGIYSGHESLRVESSLATGKSLNLEIFSNIRNIDQITTIIRSRTMYKPYTLVVVDYIQLIEVTNKKQDRRLQIAEASHALKAIANDTGTNVIAPAQLNRSSENNEEPSLSDLRECGDLEQDADIVFLAYKKSKDSKDIVFKCDKNRMNGCIYKDDMFYDHKYLQFKSRPVNNFENYAGVE
jgi:replicative DNA helicase